MSSTAFRCQRPWQDAGMSAEIVLLCEDQSTNSFVRRFLRLRAARLTSRAIHTEDLPHGSQSGEQWVREKYPDQLRAIRSQQGAWLIVVIDADRHTTQQRIAQLDEECKAQEVPPRTDSAWRTKPPRRFAEELYRMCHRAQQLREPAPPSLEESCREYTDSTSRAEAPGSPTNPLRRQPGPLLTPPAASPRRRGPRCCPRCP